MILFSMHEMNLLDVHWMYVRLDATRLAWLQAMKQIAPISTSLLVEFCMMLSKLLNSRMVSAVHYQGTCCMGSLRKPVFRVVVLKQCLLTHCNSSESHGQSCDW